MKIQANDLRIGDVIENAHGVHITVQELKRGEGGCLTTNPGQEGEINGHAWEWVEVISRDPEAAPAPEEPEPEAAVPETCVCPPGATGDEDAEPCGADDCEVAFRLEVGWP